MLKLADQLNETASKLKAHADALDDKRFIKEADRFSKSLTRFIQSLSSAMEGLTPEAAELKMHLCSSFPAGDEAIAGLSKFSQKALGKKVSKSKNDTAESYLARVFKGIVVAGKTEEALKILKTAPKHSALDLTAADELKLLEQVRALGGLDENQLDFEINHLLKHTKHLFRLADAAKIKYKPTSRPETVVKKLVQIGRRYYENTGGWGLKE